MKVMIMSTYGGDGPNLNKKYSCLNGYNYGVDKIKKERTTGWIVGEYRKRIRQVETVEDERAYIHIDSLESLKKLMEDVENDLVISKDDDFPDRLLIEIYDGYRE